MEKQRQNFHLSGKGKLCYADHTELVCLENQHLRSYFTLGLLNQSLVLTGNM